MVGVAVFILSPAALQLLSGLGALWVLLLALLCYEEGGVGISMLEELVMSM